MTYPGLALRLRRGRRPTRPSSSTSTRRSTRPAPSPSTPSARCRRPRTCCRSASRPAKSGCEPGRAGGISLAAMFLLCSLDCPDAIGWPDDSGSEHGDLRGWKRPPSSTPTSTPSTPRSSSCSTRRCAASRSPSAAASCWPPPTRPRPSACAAACRAGGRGSSARSCSSSAAISRSTSGSATPPSRCWATSRRWSSASRSTRPSPTSPGLRASVRPAGRDRASHPPPRARRSWACRSRSAWPAPSTSPRSPRRWPSPTGWCVVDPATELDFLHDLPVELMWGVGPVTKARLAETGVATIGQLAETPGQSLERLLGQAAGEKLSALAWNRDPREISTHRRARSAGAQSALGRKPCHGAGLPADAAATSPTASARGSAPSPSPAGPSRCACASPTCARSRAQRRSPAPISATTMLAEIAEDLVRGVLADHPRREDHLAAGDLGVAPRAAARRCSSSCRSGSPTRRAAPAPGAAPRAGWPTAPWTRSATASAGRRSATGRSCWKRPARSRTRSGNSPRRICDRRRRPPLHAPAQRRRVHRRVPEPRASSSSRVTVIEQPAMSSEVT